MQTFNEFLTEKKSPYKKETLEKYKKKWEKGEKIPFGIEASLKAQGIIPRADGKYEVSDEYKKEGAKPRKGIVAKFIEPETEKPESHADRVEKRIHRTEKEKMHKIKHQERITEHPDSKHKGNLKDEDFEGTIKKQKAPKKQKSFKSVKKKQKKYYNPQPKISEGSIPTFDEFMSNTYDDTEDLTIEGNVPTYNEFKNISESLNT